MDKISAPSEVSKVLEHRKYVLREFIESEREYVKRLQVAYEEYYLHIKSGVNENIPAELKNDLLSIFSTLPDIYAFHNNLFLPALEDCNWEEDHEDAEAVMDCFLKHRSEFNVYLAYCKNKHASDSTRVEYDKYFACRQSELNHKLNIEDLLITPVQKLPKYQLLIKDLLKDTRKAQLDVNKIEEALVLMLKIPRETNNIICLSLLRGISRGQIISHGSLWRQNILALSCSQTLVLSKFTSDLSRNITSTTSSNCNLKNEPRQVFLFDHRILVAAAPNSDGFFEYQTDLKTLNGQVQEVSNDDLCFTFTSEDGFCCQFKASDKVTKSAWVDDINAILDSQLQMRKALLFGKPTQKVVKTVRVHSLSVEWSDSDSSIDSMPQSDGETSDNEDWPAQTGFQSMDKLRFNKLCDNKRDTLSTDTINNTHRKKRSLTEGLHVLPDGQPHMLSVHNCSNSYTIQNQFDQTMQRKSSVLSISPRMLSRWVSRKISLQSDRAHIYFPTATCGPFGMPKPQVSTLPETTLSSITPSSACSVPEVLYIAIEDPPAVADQVYTPIPGQVFLVEDVSQVEVWKVKVLSGPGAGRNEWVQRNCLEEYCAPISTRPLKKDFHLLQRLCVGRYSEVKLARSKSNKELQAIKVFQAETTGESFYRELCIGVKMRHKNLLIYHYGIQQKCQAIAMEYINGRPVLEYLVHRGAMHERLVCHLIKQLLEGLHYMHTHTIYHLDIRPENVVIDIMSGKSTLKIIDYGAARHSGDVDEMLSHSYENYYNFQYMAPELFRKIPVAAGTDIWGVGVLIFIIFCGFTPFFDESEVRMIANVTSLNYSFPEGAPLSIPAKELVKDILVLSPEQRPSADICLGSSWLTSERLNSNKIPQYPLKHFLSKHCS